MLLFSIFGAGVAACSEHAVVEKAANSTAIDK
jgi:hypothetical protein